MKWSIRSVATGAGASGERRKMRALFYLSLSAALLCSVILADHNEDHKEENHDKHDHHKKGGHKHDHDHHHEHHSGEDLSRHIFKNSNKRFAFELFRQITEDHPSKNVAFSPISISTALGILALGARSKTREQILEGICFNVSKIPEKDIHEGFHRLLEAQNVKGGELQLNNVNALFVSENWKLLDDFQEKSQKLYQSEAIPTDFQDNEEAKKKINSYVEKKTNGKITDVLSSVSKDAALILVNTIQFTGAWQRPFNEESTKEEDFHVNKNLTVRVPFMSKTSFLEVAYLGDAIAVLLPYRGNTSALFILPKEGKLRNVESNLQDTLKSFKKSHRKRLVMISIPKFSLSDSHNLIEVLSKRGMTDLFSDKADFSGITGAPNLKISQAKHDVKIRVDENGTEAVATTVMVGTPMMLPPHHKFNEPFLLIIYDHKANSILFMGKVANPLK